MLLNIFNIFIFIWTFHMSCLVLIRVALVQAASSLHPTDVELTVGHPKEMAQVVRDHPMSPSEKNFEISVAPLGGVTFDHFHSLGRADSNASSYGAIYAPVEKNTKIY